MLFFNTYIILSFFMMLNKIYCLVNHRRDYKMKNIIIVLKKLSDESFRAIDAELLANFYGGPFTALFVIVVEIVWLILGLFSFMWPYCLGMFAFNYIINTVGNKLYLSSVTFFFLKLLYLFIYFGFCFVFLNHYFHFVDF